MLDMKKSNISLYIAVALLAGCAQPQSEQANEQEPDTLTDVNEIENAYESYEESVSSLDDYSSYTAAVNNQYHLYFENDAEDVFSADGIIKVTDQETNPSAYLMQYIDSNGMNISIYGYYYDGRLYNTYENVHYYEDMSFEDVKATLLVPMDVSKINKDQISSIKAYESENGDIEYQIVLKDADAEKVYLSSYDIYNLTEYDSYSVDDNAFKIVFDKDGHFIKESTAFDLIVRYAGQEIQIRYSSDLNYTDINQTEIALTDDIRDEHRQYVNYRDIDLSSIETQTSEDDSLEDTVEATFRKRLMNRLSYEEDEDGTLKESFNSTENYIVDFVNHTFRYLNYSIEYTYNWRGDIGAMGNCVYNFRNETSSDECEDSTVDMIKEVKSYFEMELYYCGLSLKELQEETE